MFRHFSRLVVGSCVALALSGLLLLPGQQAGSTTGPTPKSASVVKVAPAALALGGVLLREGLSRAKWGPLLETVVRLHYAVGSGASRDDVLKILADGITSQFEDIKERQDTQRNEILQQHLKVMEARLREDQRRNQLLEEQNKLTRQMNGLMVKAFEYEKWRQEEAVLRKNHYNITGDKLVIVVADFSSGNADEGKEIADEIAYHLKELTRHGIDVHILAGEIRPGIVIRSEEMVRDVGRHLPPGTDYAVIWGSMSLRTVGKYRPHITCVQHLGGNQAASVTSSIDLGAEDLPGKELKDEHHNAAYRRLIGATCATVPALYAAHIISREEIPDLDKFYRFVGKDTEEAKQFREQLEPLLRWSKARAARKDVPLRRLAAISTDSPYPRVIFNKKDNGVMVLITDAKGRARLFQEKDKGQCLVYIDVLETSNGQFLRFLNEVGNLDTGGKPWLEMDPEFRDIEEPQKGKFAIILNSKNPSITRARPVINVNWFGAREYCKWAGKNLPTEEEWKAAAEPVGEGTLPWGKDRDRYTEMCNAGTKHDNAQGGLFLNDRSRIGCFDMAGNVAEWCEDWFDQKEQISKRVVKGGSFLDKNVKAFEITARREMDQVKHSRWVGFRGVVRIPVDEVKK